MAGHGLVRLLVWFVLLCLGSPVLAQSATVVSIGDGDTVRVRLGGEVRSVRLACIDAPETAQIPWGQQARSQLQALLPIGSAVDLRSTTSDRYGRLVAQLSRGGATSTRPWWPAELPLFIGGTSLVATGRPTAGWRRRPGCSGWGCGV